MVPHAQSGRPKVKESDCGWVVNGRAPLFSRNPQESASSATESDGDR